ncbi:MAG: hypothetical protein EON89_11240 [Brevundimonas sp.]|nr:MAG: hypothetical protein EON89_11240 [Brevundimonas sp.]
MRVSIASIVLAGGLLALGACSTADKPGAMTRVEQTECQGPGTELRPTGRRTGDPRQDYRCVSVFARAERNGVTDRGAQRSMGIDRAARSGG